MLKRYLINPININSKNKKLIQLNYEINNDKSIEARKLFYQTGINNYTIDKFNTKFLWADKGS
ncbi:hypothetical protein CRS_24720 [Chryseobacterium sp. ON_d1]|nr:hypothetical protein CRS_24720 [Chryseobacterium sp. ON_d1]